MCAGQINSDRWRSPRFVRGRFVHVEGAADRIRCCEEKKTPPREARDGVLCAVVALIRFDQRGVNVLLPITKGPKKLSPPRK